MAERLIGPATIIRSAICAVVVVGGTVSILDGKERHDNYNNQLATQRAKISQDVDNEFPIPAGDIEDARKVVSELTNRVNLALKAGNVQGAQTTLEANEEQFTKASKLVGATDTNQLKKFSRERKVVDDLEGDHEKSVLEVAVGIMAGGSGAVIGTLWPVSTLISRFQEKRKSLRQGSQLHLKI